MGLSVELVITLVAHQNGEVAAYFSEVAAYSNDPSDVNVELLGGGRNTAGGRTTGRRSGTE